MLFWDNFWLFIIILTSTSWKQNMQHLCNNPFQRLTISVDHAPCIHLVNRCFKMSHDFSVVFPWRLDVASGYDVNSMHVRVMACQSTIEYYSQARPLFSINFNHLYSSSILYYNIILYYHIFMRAYMIHINLAKLHHQPSSLSCPICTAHPSSGASSGVWLETNKCHLDRPGARSQGMERFGMAPRHPTQLVHRQCEARGFPRIAKEK